MEFGIRFICEGAEKGWDAETATEAHKVIDVLSGAVKPDEFITWIMANLPQWADAAAEMVNQCVMVV